MNRLLLLTIFALFILQCSKTSIPEQPAYTFVLNEIPERIHEVENLTIFPGDSNAAFSIRLIADKIFGMTGEPYLTQIVKCVVDDKGNVIIINFPLANSVRHPYLYKVYVFNADGSYNTQLGGQGRGPGEYGMISGIQAKGEKVFILDHTSLRLNEYLTEDYSFQRSTPIEQWNNKEKQELVHIEVRDDGNYLVQFLDYSSMSGRQKIKYVVMDIEGNKLPVESLVFSAGFSIKGGQSMRPTMPLTFMGKTITALSDEDFLHAVWTRDFLIKKYNANGVYQSAIYYPIVGSPFDLNVYTDTELFSPKARDIEKALNKLDEDLPETFPVINKLMVDDENRIWAAIPVGEKLENYEWWVLKESGELLAKLVLPRDQPIYDIKNGYLYSKKVNEETNTEYVVKYKIEFTER